MARQGTASAPRQVGNAFICVVSAGVPAPIGDPHPVTHPDPAVSLEPAIPRVRFRDLLGLNFGLARLQQETRPRSQGNKWGVLSEYLQSLGTWGNNSEDVIPSLRGRSVAVPDWPFTVNPSPTSCTTFGEILPFIAPLRDDTSNFLPTGWEVETRAIHD